jgi:superfamily II DNA helicase RecQ
LPEEDGSLQERIVKGSAYISTQINTLYINNLQMCLHESDNKEVQKKLKEFIERFELALYIKQQCFKGSLEGFSSLKYLKLRADAELDFKSKYFMLYNENETHEPKTESIGGEDLYIILQSWRKMIAKEKQVPLYMIVSNKSLKELSEQQPTDLKQLLKIKGMGKVKVQQYGAEILEIIEDFKIDKSQ